MRGFTIGTQEAMFLFLAVFIGVMSIFLVFGGLEGIAPDVSNVFQNIGTVFGPDDFEPSADDYQIAKQSVTALSCAINSTMAGKELPCVKDFQSEGNATVECRFAQDRTKYWVAAKKEGILDKVKNGIIWAMGVKHRVEVFEGDVAEAITGSRLGAATDDVATPEAIWQGCKVKGFELPQETEGTKILGIIDFSPETWISGYGDPKFLAYWQQFPEGEDRSWTGFATWMENVGTVVLFALPVGSLIKGAKGVAVGGAKVAYTSISAGARQGTKELLSGILARVASKEGKEAGEELAKLGFREASERLEAAAIKGAEESDAVAKWLTEGTSFVVVEKGVSRESRLPLIAKAAEEGLKEAAETGTRNMWSRVLTAGNQYYKDSMKDLWKVVGVSTAAAWVAAHIDSVFDKYDKVPNALLLDNPYRSPLPVGVREDVYSKITRSRALTASDKDEIQVSNCTPEWLKEGGNCSKVYCSRYYIDISKGGLICEKAALYDTCLHYYVMTYGFTSTPEMQAYCDNDDNMYEIIKKAPQCEPNSEPGDNGTYCWYNSTFPLTLYSSAVAGLHPDIASPVILKKSDRERTIFYAASPCKADLRVESTKVYCKNYHYDKETGDIFCDPTTETEACHYHADLKGMMLNERYWACADHEKRLELLGSYECSDKAIWGAGDDSWCYVSGYEVSMSLDRDYEGDNFCYTQESEAAKVFLSASIALDVVLAASGVGTLIMVPLNVVEGIVYVKLKSSEEWPG